MRLGVAIKRKSWYRLLGPVVDAGLARGWSVTCFHDVSQPRGGGKGYDFPDPTAVPPFAHGRPSVVPLLPALRTVGLDAVVSLEPRPDEGLAPSAAWCILQYSGSLWRPLGPAALSAAATVGVYTDWWLDFALAEYRERGVLAGEAVERTIRSRAVTVGIPELDALTRIDPASVRQRLGVPMAVPVVLLLPYPFGSNPATPWARWVYAPGPEWWRRTRLRLAGASSLARQVTGRDDDLVVSRVLRRFCDANGAWLVVKAREKDPVPTYVAAVADRVLYDECLYPATVLELMTIAGLCVHFYSTAVMEAAGAGVPSLSICPEMAEMGTTAPYQGRFFSREEGGLFQFKGLARTMGIQEAIEVLPKLGLENFTTDPAARHDYVARFVGPVDGKASARFLDAISRRLA